MRNFLKTCFGIFLALFMGVQGILLQFLSGGNIDNSGANIESIDFNQLSLEDYAKSLPIISQGEVFPAVQEDPDIFPSIDFLHTHFLSLQYYDQTVKQRLFLSKKVEVLLDIRTIIFPSHFFW
ncbi:hypothetical protein [Anditalea andensis]|uniref:Uncharacterized protein n=1 Tax=Anditalea andensis TaxID=1048983 RepID=A0A074KPN2_9BACT|nr:hypothetical protein [Anditalea andensis]KEO71916.1 hypothetical protein EL17_20585 [Anditalea andensis]